jgi:hypothetical protein
VHVQTRQQCDEEKLRWSGGKELKMYRMQAYTRAAGVIVEYETQGKMHVGSGRDAAVVAVVVVVVASDLRAP